MKKWIFCLVIGLAMLAFSTGVGVNDGTVRCDGQIMNPGSVCEFRDRGGDVTSTQTYDEIKAGDAAAKKTFNSWGRWALLGGGLALTGLAGWGILRRRRQQKAQGPTTAGLYLQQQTAQSGAGYAHPAHTPAQGRPGQPGQYGPPGPYAPQPPQPWQQQAPPQQQAAPQPQAPPEVQPWPPARGPQQPHQLPGPPPPVGQPGYGTHPWGSPPPATPPGPHPNFGPGADEELTERY
ncbi:hypothetical protein [Actinophytocola sp.]|jgi:hypothetical protein|uniref:hypothetical protein n=1 Tax=Actinophytocola sp. TaxID=1872138 RepID=UPI002ED79124